MKKSLEFPMDRERREAREKSIAKIELVHRDLFAALKKLAPGSRLRFPLEVTGRGYGDHVYFMVLGEEVQVTYRAMRENADSVLHSKPSEKIRVTFGSQLRPLYANEKKAGHDFPKLAQMVVAEAQAQIDARNRSLAHEQRMEAAGASAERLNKAFGLEVGVRPYVDVDETYGVVLKTPRTLTPVQIGRVLGLLKDMGVIKQEQS